MEKYNYEEMEKDIEKQIESRNENILVALYNQNKTAVYPIEFTKNNNIEIVNKIEENFLHFINIFNKNPNFDKEILENNLKNKLIFGIDTQKINKDVGTTVYNENKKQFIILSDLNFINDGIIFHELFHFATKTKKNLPRGLDEGHTEALTHRYFNKTKLAYPNNVKYVLKLEEIIGKEVMENAYSKSDIFLIKEALGKEKEQILDKYTLYLDLLLGSYYRINSGKALKDEESRVQKAMQILDSCLEKLQENKLQNKKGI